MVLVIGGAIYYFTMPKDKCANVSCQSNQKCNSTSGKCETTSQNPMDRIEQSVNYELDSLQDTSLSGMDKIENAIDKKLNK